MIIRVSYAILKSLDAAIHLAQIPLDPANSIPAPLFYVRVPGASRCLVSLMVIHVSWAKAVGRLKSPGVVKLGTLGLVGCLVRLDEGWVWG